MKLLISILLFSITLFAGEIKLFGKLSSGEIILGQAKDAISIKLNNKEIDFDSNTGYFLIGFDRDETGIFYLNVKFADGFVSVKKLIIPKRKYKIQKINNLNAKLVEAPKSEKPRIDKERKIKNLAKEKIGNLKTPLYLSGFMRPVKGRMSSVFGSQRILNGIKKDPHNGVDFAAPSGRKVYATAKGKVLLCAKNFYYSGNFILLDHGQGLNSFYLHLSKILVKEGEIVNKGQIIGLVGSTGRSTGPHLHWGTQWFKKRIDPISLLRINKFLNKKRNKQ